MGCRSASLITPLCTWGLAEKFVFILELSIHLWRRFTSQYLHGFASFLYRPLLFRQEPIRPPPFQHRTALCSIWWLLSPADNGSGQPNKSPPRFIVRSIEDNNSALVGLGRYLLPPWWQPTDGQRCRAAPSESSYIVSPTQTLQSVNLMDDSTNGKRRSTSTCLIRVRLTISGVRTRCRYLCTYKYLPDEPCHYSPQRHITSINLKLLEHALSGDKAPIGHEGNQRQVRDPKYRVNKEKGAVNPGPRL